VAVWECKSAAWHEATRQIEKNPHSSGFQVNPYGAAPTFLPYPDLDQYMKLLRDYNRRKLTHANDAYRAITGLFAVWSRVYQGGFISGLPQIFLESALFWQPFDPMEKRDPASIAGMTEDFLPTWSWLGWYGEIDTVEWARHWDSLNPLYRNGFSMPRTVSIHDWYYGDDRNNLKKVNSYSMRYEDALHYHDLPLPVNWERLGPDTEQTDAASPARFLSCRTRRTFIRHESFYMYYYRGSCVSVALCTRDDKAKKVFGIITLNSSILTEEFITLSLAEHGLLADRHGFSTRKTKIENGFRGLELVELSHAVATVEGFYNEKRLREPIRKLADHPRNTDGLFELVNVMWIEWADGIAYRKAVGQIMRPTWESFDLEWIDLILG
jgi:hypothetical protein